MEKLKFKTAFKYPFGRAKGMVNIFWIFVPIFGWFALGGYGVRIVKEFIQGKFDKLPIFEFKKDMKLGFFMFIKAIPFIISYSVVIALLGEINPFVGGLAQFFLSIFVIPMLAINFIKEETIESFFEIKVLDAVFKNLGDYLIAILKSILLSFVFTIMVIILVGIPSATFTKNIFIADFYRRYIK